MNLKREHILLIILLIFYSVGTVGLLNEEYRNKFLSLTPFNLLLTCGVLLWANNEFNFRLLAYLLLIFFIGFFIEYFGVSTGVLFGEYAYGTPLGYKVGEVPLLIGVNWILISLSAGSLSQLIISNKIIILFFSAFLMTCLDVLIEPVAVKLDFWHWKDHIIPIQNYVMWFFTSLLLQFVIYKANFKLNTKAGTFVLLIQFIFFAILNLLLK